MKLQSFTIRMTQEEARSKAMRQTGVLGRLMVGKDPEISMRTIFIENKIITYRITNEPSILARLLRRGRLEQPRHQSLMRVIANGSTAGVSYYDGQGAEIVELGDIYRAFGAEVTILEALPQLIRGADSSCADLLRRSLEKNGVRVELNASVKKIEGSAGCKKITFEQDGSTKTMEADAVLAATGREPNTEGLRLEKAGVRTDRKGWIETDSHMRTSVPHIYAAGDVTGRSLFAHTAYEAGSTAVENMAGRDCEMRYDAVPQVVFASTEIAWTGLTEETAAKAGYKPVVGVFPLSANGKAIAEGETEGFVKVVSETEYHRVLGVHMAGPSASEMITTGVSLLAQEQGLEDVEATIYPHPSVSEAIREACLIAAGKALHS